MAAWVMLLIPFAIGYPWLVDLALTRFEIRAEPLATKPCLLLFLELPGEA